MRGMGLCADVMEKVTLRIIEEIDVSGLSLVLSYREDLKFEIQLQN